MSSILNGVRWTEKRLTDEQLSLLEDAENRNLGCLKCEGISNITEKDFFHFSMRIEEDKMSVVVDDFETGELGEEMTIQITYCPFCGKKL